MKNVPIFVPRWLTRSLMLAAFALAATHSTQAQVVPAGDRGGLKLSVGGTVSGFVLGYGQAKLLGGTIFVDADGEQHFGAEFEGRMLLFHQTNQEHANTWMVGPRYSYYFGRFQPYVKGLVGIGQFTYPWNYAKDNDLVYGLGGGVDFRITHRIRWRAVDFEYQGWPQFHYGSMSSYGLSTGIRIKIR